MSIRRCYRLCYSSLGTEQFTRRHRADEVGFMALSSLNVHDNVHTTGPYSAQRTDE